MTEQSVQQKPSIGWIGLGKMGTPIVINLLKAGYDVAGYDVDPARAGEVAAHGARPAPDVASLAASAQLVFSIIPDDTVLAQVALGSRGVIANLARGGVY